MTDYSDIFLDYDKSSTDFDKALAPEIYVTSSYSGSTPNCANSLSPEVHNLFQSNEPIQYGDLNFQENLEFQPYGYSPENQGFPPEEKESSKEKRIMKRKIAKERTKSRQDAMAFLSGVDPKFIPDEFYNPDLDERSKKKMIQMIRNRVSAQTSREKKKMYTQKLEDLNAQLIQENSVLYKEKEVLLNEINKLQQNEARLLQEKEALQTNNVCSSCRCALNRDSSHYEDNIEDLTEDIPRGLSNLASPILSRFSSSGRGLFTFLTFAAVVSLIVVVSVQQKGEIKLQGFMDIEDRLLEVDNDYCQNPIICPDNINPKVQEADFPYKNSLVIKNIEPFKHYFDLNYELTFKNHLHRSKILNINNYKNFNNYDNYNNFIEPSPSNAIIPYQKYEASNLRRKIPTIIAQDLSVLNQISDNPQVQTSTLFCPKAFEFSESNYKETDGADERSLKERSLDLEQAEYLQLFIPRQGLARYDSRGNIVNLEDFSGKTDESEAMLEIWCKVFLIRELTSEY